MLKRTLLLCLFTVFAAGTAFSQSYDMPINTGARMNAMANSGSAIVDGGVAIAMNPAGLANTKKIQVEGTFNQIAILMGNPANGAYREKSVTAYSAIGLFGMGVRLNEVITVGFLLYAPSGGGVRNKNVTMGFPVVPKDFDGYLVFLEFGPAIALNLPGGFKIGFVYRINYAESWSSLYTYDPSGSFLGQNYMYNTNHLSGYGFTGYRIGIQWDPVDTFHMGVSYRSYVKIESDGTSDIQPYGYPFDVSVNIAQTLRYADGIQAGVSYEFIPDRLTVNADYILNFWSRYKNRTTEMMGIPNVTKLRNKNVHGARIGAEFAATDRLILRLGFSWSSGQANRRYQNLLSMGAPGTCQVYGGGVTYRLAENWDISFAANYMINQGHVSGFDYVKGGMVAVPGDYKNNGMFLSLGLRYNLM